MPIYTLIYPHKRIESVGTCKNPVETLVPLSGCTSYNACPCSGIHTNRRDLLSKRHVLTGSLIGGIAETQERLDFCAEYDIRCDIAMIDIQDINTAVEHIMRLARIPMRLAATSTSRSMLRCKPEGASTPAREQRLRQTPVPDGFYELLQKG